MRVIKRGDRAHVEVNEPVLIEVNNSLIPVILTHSYSCGSCPIRGDDVVWLRGECREWADCLRSPQGLHMVPIEEAVE